MRVKRLLHGLAVEPGHPFPAIREHTFMDNPNVPEEIKVCPEPEIQAFLISRAQLSSLKGCHFYAR